MSLRVKELLEMSPGLRRMLSCSHTLICYIIDHGPTRVMSPFPPKILNYQVAIPDCLMNTLWSSYITDVGSNNFETLLQMKSNT